MSTAIPLSALLCAPELALPQPAASNYADSLEALLNQYNALLKNATDPHLDPADLQGARKSAKQLGDALVETVRISLSPRPTRAYDCFEKALTAELSSLQRMATGNISGNAIGNWWRVRLSLDPDSKPSDMFHIPFERRHLVARQRYSYPGVPCLYLGASLYACWKEMGQCDLDSMSISTFKVADTQSLRLLDIGWRPHWIAGLMEAKPNVPDANYRAWIKAYITLVPLIAACTYPRFQQHNAPFVPEYIIPQMLTSWLVDQSSDTTSFDAIRYFSANIIDEGLGMAAMNLVVPAVTRPDSGHCATLTKKWQVSRPVTWQQASAIPAGQINSRFRDEKLTFAGVEIDYRTTQFSEVETTISSRATPVAI